MVFRKEENRMKPKIKTSTSKRLLRFTEDRLGCSSSEIKLFKRYKYKDLKNL